MATTTFEVSPHDPDVLDKRESTGCLRRLGFGLLLAGSACLFGLWKAFEAGKATSAVATVLVVLGALLLLAGGFCTLVRGGTHLDRRQKVEVSWWRVLGLGRRKETPFAGCDRVTIEKDTGDSDSPTTYPVRLAGPAGVEGLAVDKPSDYQQARVAGERVARFLDLPLHDSSAGMTTVRQPAELDEPLRARLRRTGGAPPLPSAPPDPRARIEETSDGLRIEIAGAGATAVGWIPVALATVFSIVVGLSILPSLLRGGPSVFLLIGALFVLAPLLLTLKGAGTTVLRRTVVVASRLALRVEGHAWLTRTTVEIPADELEELILLRLDAPSLPPGQGDAEVWKWSLDHGRMPDGRQAPGALRWLWRLASTPGILARSDRASVVIGTGLPPEELAYLHGRLLRALE
jgi:hypothetical protein